MKNVALIILLISSLRTAAQVSEITFSIGPNIPFLPKQESSFGTPYPIIPSTSGYTSYTLSGSLQERYESTPGAQANISVRYKLKNKFFLNSGWGLSYTRFRQITKVKVDELYSSPGVIGQSQSIHQNNSGNLGKTRLLQMQIPILVGMTSLNNKFVFQTGLIFSATLKADTYVSELSRTGTPVGIFSGLTLVQGEDVSSYFDYERLITNNYEINEKRQDATSNFNSFAVGVIFSAGYNIAKHIRVDVFGQPHLTKLYKAESNSDVRMTTFGINANYILANRK